MVHQPCCAYVAQYMNFLALKIYTMEEYEGTFKRPSNACNINFYAILLLLCTILLHFNLKLDLQWFALENQQSPCYVVNEVTFTGQNPSLKFCQPLELFNQLKKGLDLLFLKIWSLLVKRLQSYWPSNFENNSNMGVLESGPSGLSGLGLGGRLFLETSNFDSQ